MALRSAVLWACLPLVLTVAEEDVGAIFTGGLDSLINGSKDQTVAGLMVLLLITFMCCFSCYIYVWYKKVYKKLKEEAELEDKSELMAEIKRDVLRARDEIAKKVENTFGGATENMRTAVRKASISFGYDNVYAGGANDYANDKVTFTSNPQQKKNMV
jgi:hypothetical protein